MPLDNSNRLLQQEAIPDPYSVFREAPPHALQGSGILQIVPRCLRQSFLAFSVIFHGLGHQQSHPEWDPAILQGYDTQKNMINQEL